MRVSTVQRVTAAGLRRIAVAGITLAEAEGLSAHAQSLASGSGTRVVTRVNDGQ